MISFDDNIDEVLQVFDKKYHEIEIFMEGVRRFIGDHPELNDSANPIVHSYRSRIKNRDHLAEKIRRKNAEGRAINAENILWQITDLAGVRILHLF